MYQNSYTPEEFIAKFLAGEADSDEIRFILKKIKSEKEWNDIYMRGRKIFDATNSAAIDDKIDVDKAINYFLVKTEKATFLNNQNWPVKKIAWQVLSMAAAIAIIFLVWKWFGNPSKVEVYSGNNYKAGIELPDGSVVNLNPNSKISFPNKFAANFRKIDLEGTAFFKVQKNAKKLFIVSTKDIEIKVVGTSFWVYANLNDSITSVKVKTGRVLLLQKENNKNPVNDPLVLTVGDSGVIMTNTHKLYVIKSDSTAHEKIDIHFDKTPLADAILVLNKIYKIRIQIANHAIDHCRITAHFENQSLGAILKMFSTILPVTIREDNGIIIIDGNGC